MAFSSMRGRRAVLTWILGSLAACSGTAVFSASGPEAPPDVATGRRLYLASCAGCHGVRGDASGEVAASLFPPPRDLTRGEFRFRSTASGTLPTRDDLARTIALGLPGSAMPGWGDVLNDSEIGSIVLFVETLSLRFAAEARRPEDVLLPADLTPLAATPELVARGAVLYQKMGCGECHGPQGRGDGQAAATARNSDGTPSHVFDFTYGVYKGGDTARDIYRTFVTGLDGAPMPAFDQSLPDQTDRWALVAYVQSLGRPRGLAFYLTERPTWREPMAAARPRSPQPLPVAAPVAAPAADAPRADGW